MEANILFTLKRTLPALPLVLLLTLHVSLWFIIKFLFSYFVLSLVPAYIVST